MANNISSLIESQLPEYLRESAPLLLGFVETYYAYAQQRTKSIGLVQYHAQELDIDLTDEIYVTKFYEIYGEFLPQSMAIDRRNFIKLLNSVYEAKGTEKALKLIFKALFKDEISITYPSNNILKASDGKWEKLNFITLQTISGIIPGDNFKLSISNMYGDFTIDIAKIEKISEDLFRLFYIPQYKLLLENDQLLQIYSDTSSILYVGKLVKSPSRLKIKRAGQVWQRGQVILIGGTVKPTVARVTNIDSDGGITSLEILEYGYMHTPNQEVTISPYSAKPVDTGSTIESTLISINPTVYSHVINIRDNTEGIYEDITGISSGVLNNSYFDTTTKVDEYGVSLNYLYDLTYTGIVTIQSASSQGVSKTAVMDFGITIEQWLASRAVISYEFSNVVEQRGSYRDQSGQVSNSEIKLHDSYFYQAFSYVLETSRDIRDYAETLNITHPAGSKRFSNLTKQIEYTFDFSSSRVLSHDTIYVFDISTASDDYRALHLTKPKFDDISVIDDFFTKDILKNILVESSSVIELNSIIAGIVSYDLEQYFAENYVRKIITLEIG